MTAHPKTAKALGFAPQEDVRELYEAKLASSGITPEQAEYMGMDYLDASASRAAGLWHQGLPALRIPYFNPYDSSKRSTPAPGWPAFWRARCLRTPLNPPDHFAKYLQPTDTGVCPYFPVTSVIDWPVVLLDHSQMILFTEGELKAAKACWEGFPTVGLGGVWNFQAKRPYSEFLPELEKITWPRRTVYIVYDSDVIKNKDVANAAWRLAEKLRDRGALPYLVVIPDAGDQKVGLDDFLVAEKPDALAALLRDARALTEVQSLWELNEGYALLYEGDAEVVDIRAGIKIKASQLKYRTTGSFNSRRLDKSGTIIQEPINAATAWIDWPLRQTARRLAFDPSRPPLALFENGEREDCPYDFNTWRGFAAEPKEGDVTPFLNLIDHVFKTAPKESRDWFLDWLAYPVQHPGVKMFSAAIIFGAQGSGKTLIGETMRRIYGKAYTMITNSELENPTFNEWAAEKCFILGDDITGFEKMRVHDLMKQMITRTVVRINPKGLTAYELEDHVNWLFTSNRSGALHIDRDDRRYFVHEVPLSTGRMNRVAAKAYMRWLDGDGPSALMNYLISRDVSKFDPGAPPLETSSKLKMRQEGRGHIYNWCDDLADNPDDILTISGTPMTGDLFTTRQLCTIYAAQTGEQENDRLTARMASALSASGFNLVNKRGMIRCKGKDPARYYAVRNPDKWLSAPLAELQAHLTEDPKKPAGKKF